ncbi:MAG: aldehyde dehydrogenase family protein [Pyrinomonadaceae bacterium]|nr:aldehyde dehydrogenase family protein [Pyrinomonadaceae bacterium]
MSVETLDIKEAARGEEIVSYDPATGEALGRVPLLRVEAVVRAVQAARAAQKDWAARSFRERGRIVLAARGIVLKELEEIAALIHRESGKPAAEAISMELVPTLDLMQFFARKSVRLLKPERVGIGQYSLMGRSSKIIYKPLGVIGIISPWNFPWAIPMGEVVMALMAGNAVVLKPSELTPLIGLKIGEVFRRAGLPEGLLQVVTGDGSTGAALVEAGVDKIMFTGSVATGKRVAEMAARRLMPVVLELGGKDPMIVMDDADVERAAHAAVWGAFANSGQACASVERCYVQSRVAQKFINRIVELTRGLKQSAILEEEPDIGSMSSERQLEVVEQHVQDALSHNARALTGGRRKEGAGGWFYEPTVLVDVDHSMKVMRDETFGPVLPVMTFETEDEAIRLANDSVFGLTASVWTKNISRGRHMAEQIQAGTVMVNEVLYTHGIAQAPWGGVKESGLGHTHGRLGLLELVQPVHVHVNRMTILRDFWWFNYTPRAAQLFRGFARRFATGNPLQTSLLLPSMIRRYFERRS